jgi:hypothetical protein
LTGWELPKYQIVFYGWSRVELRKVEVIEETKELEDVETRKELQESDRHISFDLDVRTNDKQEKESFEWKEEDGWRVRKKVG